MGDSLKYVIVTSMGLEVPIIFPALLDHNYVAQGYNAVSAGYVSVQPRGDGFFVDVWGKSTTLGLQSRPEDVAIIVRELTRPLD
jgi:hypothetical protein